MADAPAPGPSPAPGKPFPVVGVGASAGGLEAFTELLGELPVDTGMAFVLIQHLDPAHISVLTQILTRATAMPVSEVTDNMPAQPNHIYVIPPNASMIIAKGVLKLQPRRAAPGSFRSIDPFFESLAQDQKEHAIGVILSGTATDGTLGLEAIKGFDGITFAQDESAKYESMPRSAVAAGCVDFVLSPRQIAQELARISRHPYVAGEKRLPPADDISASKKPQKAGKPAASAEQSEENGFRKILLLLRNHSEVDFSLYKTNTIQRRITRRMVLNKLTTLDEYAHFLRGNAKELDGLYADVLINVTSFFRNPDAFEALKRLVFPKVLFERRTEPVRVWVVGCSSGQEAYSIAMAYTEFAQRVSFAPKLQIFGTDLNEALLEKARIGLYPKALLQDLAPERVRRFFTEEEGGYRVIKSLRDSVVFARQNLLSDPPFSRMDLISCRNLMIYLDASLQQKIIPTFHYALKPGGYLFLGAAESIGTFVDLFDSLDRKHKIYSKKPGPTPALHLHSAPIRFPKKETLPAPQLSVTPDSLHAGLNAQREADRIALNRYAPPGVLLNAEWQVLQFRGETSPYLKPPTGKASFNVLNMAREGLMLPLRTTLQKAKRERNSVRRENIQVNENNHTRKINIEVVPLNNLKDSCFAVFFEDPVEHLRLIPQQPETFPGAEGLSSAARGPAGARRKTELERELAETRDFLQSLQEQHEASNEELQASNEEVTSANEELQSINEELETSKEELESANEELLTVNEEMSHRNAELSRLNSDLINFQSAADMAIVLLGPDQTIRRYTLKGENIFNLAVGDVGRSLHAIRHNLEVPDLEQMIAGTMADLRECEREVRDRKGHWYSLRIRPYRSVDNTIDGTVLMAIDIDALKRSAQEIAQAREYAEGIVRTTRDMLVVLNGDLEVQSANQVFYETFQTTAGEVEGRLVYELGNGQWDIPRLRELLEKIIPRTNFFLDFEITHDFPGIGLRTMLLNARLLNYPNRPEQRILLGIHDITEHKRSEEFLRQSELRFRTLTESIPEFVWICTPGGQCTYLSPQWGKYTGLPENEHLERKWREGIHPDDLESVNRAWQSALQEKNNFVFEYRLRGAAGEYRWFRAHFVPILDNQGKLVNWFGTCTDIDDQMRSKDVLEQTVAGRTAELRETVQELEAFSYSLSHDLRAPLRAMIGYADLLQENYSPKLDDQGQDYLRRIASAAIRMDSLVQDVLNYTRILRVGAALTGVSLDKLVRDMLQSYPDFQCPKAEVEIEGTLPEARGHEGFLAQAISNLLHNAVKFVAPGVVPHVRIRAGESSAAGYVRLCIQDNGIGIDPADQERIFRLFGRIQPESAYDGTGIGLTIVRKVVERMDGRVGFDSVPGKGSTFWIELRKP